MRTASARDAIKTILKCQQDEFRRGKVLTQKGYGIPAVEVFTAPKEREESACGAAARKILRHAVVQPEGIEEGFHR